MPKEWWVSVAPWLKHLVTFFKYAVPLGHDIGAVIDSKVITNLEAQITLFETIITDMGDATLADERAEVEHKDHDRVTGSALRALYVFLDKADASHHWGGLQKVITPEGNIFWLCAEHRAPYEAKLLQLPV